MLTGLEAFNQDKAVHIEKLQEVSASATSEEDHNKKIAVEKERYRGQIRKYLPQSLSTIKTIFGSEYSLYKIGKDYSSEFNIIETNVKKSKAEITAEMQAFVEQATSMNLSAEQIVQLNIAIDVLITYTDEEEVIDQYKAERLEGLTATASSIITVPNRDATTGAVATTSPVTAPATTTFNPYADQPVTLGEGFGDPSYNKVMISDPFANLYGGASTPVSAPIPSPVPVIIPETTIITNETNIFGADLMKQPDPVVVSEPLQAPAPPEPVLAPVPVHTIQPEVVSQPVQPVIQQPIIQEQQLVVHEQPEMAVIYMPGVEPTPQPQLETMLPPNMVVPAPAMVMMPEQPAVPTMPAKPVEMEYVCDNRFVQNTGTYQPKQDNSEGIVIGAKKKPKGTLLWRLLIGIIGFPLATGLMTAVICFALTMIGEHTDWLEQLAKFVGNGNYMIGILLLVIIFITGPVSSLFVKLINQKITKYVGKFIMLPCVMLVGFALISPELMTRYFDNFSLSLNSTVNVVLYWLVWILVSMWFIVMLCINSFFAFCDRSGDHSSVKWNGIEKLSLLGIFYTCFIPLAYMIMVIFKVTVADEIFTKIYGFDNITYIAAGTCGVFAILMFLLNIKEDFQNRRQV